MPGASKRVRKTTNVAGPLSGPSKGVIKRGPGQVYAQLRELIVKRQLLPGQRIVESELSQQLGVSRTPLREALLLLLREGYLTAGQGGQARLSVAPLTRDDAMEMFWIVGEIEGLAAERAACLPKSEREALVAELTRINRDFRRLHREGGHRERLFELDEAFHRAYVAAGSGPRLVALHDITKPGAERYERIYFALLTKEVVNSYQEHEAIIAAIRAGAAEAARVAVRTNWRNAADRIADVIDIVGSRPT